MEDSDDGKGAATQKIHRARRKACEIKVYLPEKWQILCWPKFFIEPNRCQIYICCRTKRQGSERRDAKIKMNEKCEDE